MKLLGPAFLGVEATEKQHKEGREPLLFDRHGGGTGAGLGENDGGLAVAAWCGVAASQSVIREPSAVDMKEIMSLLEGIEKIIEGGDFSPARFLQAVDPCIPCDPEFLLARRVGRKVGYIRISPA